VVEGEMALSDREFARVKARVHAEAGIALSDAKRTMVVSRLSKLVRQRRLASFDAYLDFLETKGSAQDAQDFVNALTTNLTRFYREDHHFTHLVTQVGEIMAQRGGAGRPRLRIWSAGCSTGQEAYTAGLALLAAYPELRRWDFRILATDIDTNVLARAAAGIYPQSELSGLSPARAAAFEPAGAGMVRVPEAVRALVAFKPLNLMAPNWPMRGPFDAIFCRNVAIYFDRPTQARLFARLGALLEPGAFLYIGHSENLATSDGAFRLVGKTIYQYGQQPKARKAA
jgi:chemotaxis protein methyltransferase CheR